MRTSRISTEIARVISALTPRRSTRSMRKSSPLLEVKTEIITSSPLSSPPASPVDSLTQIPRLTKPSITSGRKRKFAETTIVKTEDVSPRRTSPRTSTIDISPSAESDHVSAEVGFPRKTRRQPAKRIKGPNGDIKFEPPVNWERVYDITSIMRKRVLAPVDTMGCESLAEDHRSLIDRRLQTLVALMLSSQTKDIVTFAAMRNLQENLPGGFTLSSLISVDPPVLNDLIAKVGFHNNKTKYIKQTAEILQRDFQGDIPDTIDGLISLPGVGPKMAYLCMSAAWGRDEGIGVDVHVHRITNLWGWHKTNTPEETRAALEAWLPKEKWHDINHLLVGFGQTICLPVGRKCSDCDLAKEGLCPSAVVPKMVKKRTKVEQIKPEAGVVKSEVHQEAQIKLERADNDAPPLDLSPLGNARAGDIEGS